MELRLLGRPLGLLQLALVKSGLFVAVHSRGSHHIAPRVAPGRTSQLLWWCLDRGLWLRLRQWLQLLRLLRGRLQLCEILLWWLVI